MKLSKRIRYGIRAMLELAENTGKEPIQVKTIAERQEISPKYLEQLMAVLKASGIIRSARGSKGGYILAKDPADIRLSEIFRSLEGPIDIVECVNNDNYCAKSADCKTRQLWAQIQQAVLKVLNSLTLKDLSEMKPSQKTVNYQI